MGLISHGGSIRASIWLVVAVLVTLAVIRGIGLHFSVVDLFFDEAQYWAWSRELAFGYFSKPPLLAWIIAVSDGACGSGEACVRIASPILGLGSSLLIYAIARTLYDRTTAAWTAVAFALGTGMAFSARIISTDVPLLFFWSLALLAYVKLLPAPDWRWAIAFGVACGLGLLAKYAMIYFLLGAAIAACFDKEARALWTRPQTWLALAAAALIISPNVYWNAAHDFVTLKHTGDNITGDGPRFQPARALEFLASQFAVAGPLIFGGFLVILARMRRLRLSRADLLMIAFAIPALALVTAVSFGRGANPNWAAVSIPSMTILVVAFWVRHGFRRTLWATVGIGLVVQATLLVGDANAYRITVPALGRKADLYERTLGWRGLGHRAGELAHAIQAPTVVADGRAEMAALIYYLRNDPLRVLSWPSSTIPEHHFDLTRAFSNSAAEPVLFISTCALPARLKHFYERVTPLGRVAVHSGASSVRVHFAFKLANRLRDIGPLGPCVESTDTPAAR